MKAEQLKVSGNRQVDESSPRASTLYHRGGSSEKLKIAIQKVREPEKFRNELFNVSGSAC